MANWQHGSLLRAASPRAPAVPGIAELTGKNLDPEPLIEFWGQEICQRLNLKATGGSDAHQLTDIPTSATEFERDITSLEDLITELKAGRFHAVDLRKGR